MNEEAIARVGPQRPPKIFLILKSLSEVKENSN